LGRPGELEEAPGITGTSPPNAILDILDIQALSRILGETTGGSGTIGPVKLLVLSFLPWGTAFLTVPKDSGHRGYI